MLIDLATKYDRFRRRLSFEVSFFKKLTKQLKISLQHQIFRPSKYYKVNNNLHKKPSTLKKAAATVLPTNFFPENQTKANSHILQPFESMQRFLM